MVCWFDLFGGSTLVGGSVDLVGGSTGLVVCGWWSCLSFSCSVRSLLSCSVSCLVFAVCGGWGCFPLVLFVPWCCLGVWCLHVALAFALVLPWFGEAWCCWGSIGAARLLGGVAWWWCLVLLGCYLGAWGLVGASTATGVDDDEQINGGGDRWRGVEHEQEC